MLDQIKRTIFTTSLVWLLIGAVLLIAVGAVFATSSLPYFQGKLGEATSISPARLSRGEVQIPTYFAQVEGDATYNTGYYYEDTAMYVIKSEDYYGLLEIGDKFLLIYTPDEPDETRTEWTGSLYTTTREVQREVVDKIKLEVPQIAEDILPYTLSVVDAEHWQWWAGLVILAVTGIAGGLFLVRGLQRLSDPTMHPIWERLARHGDVPMTVAAIERDLSAGAVDIGGKVKLGRSWIIKPGRGFTAMKIDDVVWLHKYTVTHRTNGIRTMVSHSAKIFDVHGTELDVSAKEQTVVETLTRVFERAPWAVAGHSADIENAWKKDRPMFLRSVAERKRSMAEEQR
jgi:hypothetical protein